MVFLRDLGAFTAAAPSGPEGLDLAEEAINDVINRIDEQQERLLPVNFAFAALISDASFGAGESAPNLSLHYGRAHEVTYKTLRGIKEDLLSFQQACRDAKNEIIAADDETAGRMRATQSAVDVLEDGSRSRRGERDHREAQQDQDVTGGGQG